MHLLVLLDNHQDFFFQFLTQIDLREMITQIDKFDYTRLRHRTRKLQLRKACLSVWIDQISAAEKLLRNWYMPNKSIRRHIDLLKGEKKDKNNTLCMTSTHASKSDSSHEATGKPISILVAIEQPIFRFGLASLLEEQPDFTVVGTAGNCDECYQRALQLSPDILLCDIDTAGAATPENSSLGWCSFEALRDALPELPAILLHREESDNQILEASNNGIRGYVTTNTSCEDLFNAVRVVKDGGTFLEQRVQSKVFAMLKQLNDGDASKTEPLNDKERTILQLLAQGKRNQEIADDVFLSISSVKRYVSTLCTKLGASNRAEAVRIGISKHLISADAPSDTP